MKKDTSLPTGSSHLDLLSHNATMARLKAGMDRLGDLPIFSTSINKVRRVSSDPQADAMAVAQEVLKDANLSSKLLRLANSAYYNRGLGKISVISRAVIMMGFETVRNLTLTLKLIESFQKSNTAVDMSRLLVRSYLAAGLVRNVATKCGVKDIEESYVCALLHNLGEIIVAYVLPHEFMKIQEQQKLAKVIHSQAQHNVLGTSFDAIGQDLAGTWEFPPLVVSSMSRTSIKISGVVHDRLQINRALSFFANDLVGALYVEASDSAERFSSSMRNLAAVTGSESGLIEHSLGESFRMSCALAHDYGLDKNLLKPLLGEGDDTARDKWARQFSYLASTGKEQPASPIMVADDTNSLAETGNPSLKNAALATPLAAAVKPVAAVALVPISASDTTTSAAAQPVATAPSSAVTEPAAATIHEAQLQLTLIQEISNLIAQGARLNQVFVKALEGIQRGVGFDRVILCLVTPDRRNYVARLAVGQGREQMKEFFALPIEPQRDFFSKVLIEGGEVLVADTAHPAYAALLPKDFLRVAAVKSFIVVAVSYEGKPVGFFYADRSVSQRLIDAGDLRNMVNFVTQARLALRLCS